MIHDARALLDWLEAHPDVPMPNYGVQMAYSINGGSDATEMTELERIAVAAGVPVTGFEGRPVTDEDSHRRVAYRIGSATYKATSIRQSDMDAYNRHMDAFRKGGE